MSIIFRYISINFYNKLYYFLKGLPEPPVDIQVEPGPQDGTLLVTWQPPNASSSVGGSMITGYAVYADGKKVTDVDSPSGELFKLQ